MSALPLPQPLSETDYLEFERISSTRHEFISGQVVAMAGGSERHALILLNTASSLHAQLRHKPCKSYASDLRVKMGKSYAYPDVVVVCGDAFFSDMHKDTLLNPTLIVEVLSPSTEVYDRGAKFIAYQTIADLRDYLIISHDSPRVEHYTRHEVGWLLRIFTTLSDVVTLASIGESLLLADVYERVSFD